MTGDYVKSAIEAHHTGWNDKIEGVFITELHTNTGYAAGEPNKLDAWWMGETLSKGLLRVAYEVKTRMQPQQNESKDALNASKLGSNQGSEA